MRHKCLLSNDRSIRNQGRDEPLLSALQFVVSQFLTRLPKTHPFIEHSEDFLFNLVDLHGCLQHLFGPVVRDDHDAGIVTNKDIIGPNEDLAHGNRNIDRIQLNPVFACHRDMPPRKYRILRLENSRHVATNAVNDRTRNAPFSRIYGHNVAPHGAVGSSAIIENDDLALLHVVEEIAHGPLLHAARAIADGKGAPYGFCTGDLRLYSCASALDAQTVESVRNSRGIQLLKLRYELVHIVNHPFPNSFSSPIRADKGCDERRYNF